MKIKEHIQSTIGTAFLLSVIAVSILLAIGNLQMVDPFITQGEWLWYIWFVFFPVGTFLLLKIIGFSAESTVLAYILAIPYYMLLSWAFIYAFKQSGKKFWWYLLLSIILSAAAMVGQALLMAFASI